MKIKTKILIEGIGKSFTFTYSIIVFTMISFLAPIRLSGEDTGSNSSAAGEDKKLMFEDDFSGGLDKWIDGDKGFVREGWYHLGGKQGVLYRIYTKGSEDWTDYVVEFDVRIENGIASWMVRCDLSPKGKGYYLFCLDGVNLERNVRSGKNYPAGRTKLKKQVKHRQPCHVKIVVRGSVVKHYIDGELVDRLTDDTITSGGFGFRQMNHEEGAFGNVKIYALPEINQSMGPGKAALAPFASIPFAVARPRLDGRIGQDEWAAAARLTGFSDLGGMMAEKQTTVFALWDSENLYLAFESKKMFERNVPQRPRDDNGLFGKDAIEINLKPGSGNWMKLAFDHVGSRWDARLNGRQLNNEKWDPEWTVKNHLISDGFYVSDTWQAEVAIPFSSLDVQAPSPGMAWRVQICRDLDDMKKLGYPVSRRWTSWSPATEGGFNEPGTFGTFQFVKDASVFRLESYSGIKDGVAGLRGTLVSTARGDLILGLRAWIDGRPEAPLVNEKMRITASAGERAPVSVDQGMNVLEVADVFVAWDLKERTSGRTVAAATVKFVCVPVFALTYVPLLTLKTVVIDGDISRMRNLPEKAVIAMEVRDAGGAALSRARIDIQTGRKKFLTRLSLNGVPPGTHTIDVRMLDTKGKSLASSSRLLDVLYQPEWTKKKTGALTEVPTPWTPVEVEHEEAAVTVKTWSKAYRYERGILPAQIRIHGRDRLAAPAELVIVTDRGRETIRCRKPRVSDVSPLGATLTWEGSSGQIDVVNTVRIEFDGLIWNETSIVPKAGRVTIRQAYIELPLAKKGLRYMRGENSMNFMKSTAYIALIAEAKLDGDWPLPHENPNFSANGWKWPQAFINFYWAGGVDYGIFAVFKSPRNMVVSDKYNELIEEADRALLRFYLIDKPFVLADARRYEYGLMGTPTRQIRDRSQMNRTGFFMVKDLGAAYFKHEIERQWDGAVTDKFFTGPTGDVKKGDIYAKHFHVGVLSYLGNPYPNEEELKSIRHEVNLSRKLGTKPMMWLNLTYTPIGLSHERPYEFEWEQYPQQRYVYGGEQCTLVCPKLKSWSDFYLFGVDKLMKEEHIGGFYLDMTGPGSCSNHYHGCGYEEDGEIKGEIAFLELRDLFLRLYNVVHRNDPGGIVFYHSNTWNPTVLYADMDTKGEGWSSAEDYRTFSLPYYQAGYMVQHQYNIAHNFFATHLYCSYRGKPERVASLAECVGLALVHDTLPCASTSLEVAGLVTVYNALDDFGAYEKDTKWIPYWESGIGDWKKGVAASYYHKGDGVFLVLFNSQFEGDRDVVLNLAKLLGPGAVTVRNILTGKVAPAHGKLRMTIGPRNIQLLILR